MVGEINNFFEIDHVLFLGVPEVNSNIFTYMCAPWLLPNDVSEYGHIPYSDCIFILRNMCICMCVCPICMCVCMCVCVLVRIVSE